MVERPLMVRCFVRWIPHDGIIELFFVPVSASQWHNKSRRMCHPVCGMVHMKDPLVLIEKVSYVMAAAGFLSRLLSSP